MKNDQEQENDIKLTMTRSKKISTRGRTSLLDKDMMDNPFAKKATVRKKATTKRLLIQYYVIFRVCHIVNFVVEFYTLIKVKH